MTLSLSLTPLGLNPPTLFLPTGASPQTKALVTAAATPKMAVKILSLLTIIMVRTLLKIPAQGRPFQTIHRAFTRLL